MATTSNGNGNGVPSLASQILTYENLVHALSGMTGGVSAISMFFPLNSLRMRLQVDEKLRAENPFVLLSKIAKKEGIQSLYVGWWSSIVSLGFSNFVYFYVYNALKLIYLRRMQKKDMDPLTNLAIASFSGTVNVLATTPLWVVGTRLAVQNRKRMGTTGSSVANGEAGARKPYKGVWNSLCRIASEEGIGALWKGVGPSLILVSNPSIQFLTYERLRAPLSRYAEKRGSPITAFEFFIIGAIAKAVATVLTYPLQIAQSKLRADKGQAKDPSQRNYKGTLDCLEKIAKKNGVAGWYKGMETKLWQTVLTAAFQFLTYEKTKALVFYLLFSGKASSSAAGGGSILNAVKKTK